MSDKRTTENDSHLLADWWANVGQSGSDAERLAKRVLELEREVAALRAKTIEECVFAIGELDGGDPEIDRALDEAMAACRALKGKP